jgi:hypothetical protein
VFHLRNGSKCRILQGDMILVKSIPNKNGQTSNYYFRRSRSVADPPLYVLT